MTGMGTRKGQASVGSARQAPPRALAGMALILRRSSTCFSAMALVPGMMQRMLASCMVVFVFVFILFYYIIFLAECLGGDWCGRSDQIDSAGA